IRVNNDEEGRTALVAWAREKRVERVAMEATGGLELEVALALDGAAIQVSIVNPRQVRRFAEAMGRLEKTDAIDARMLAEFCSRMKPRATKLADAMQRELG